MRHWFRPLARVAAAVAIVILCGASRYPRLADLYLYGFPPPPHAVAAPVPGMLSPNPFSSPVPPGYAMFIPPNAGRPAYALMTLPAAMGTKVVLFSLQTN